MLFQSTQPEWAATRYLLAAILRILMISIHAARVGCDTFAHWLVEWGIRISIHAARVGCDAGRLNILETMKHFNPRSPSGLRQAGSAEGTQFIIISIHAARVGCD